jgi:ABC-2 type transport system ATP-binding protein
MLLDYVRPTDGTATVFGLDAHEDVEAIRRRIGVLPEGFGLYDRLSARRHLEFARDWKDADTDIAAVLERVGLSAADADRPVGGFSKGMQQRLALGMALVGDPDLIILDEPSSGLDPNGIRRMRQLVRQEAAGGTTVFFSSHILGQVEAVCDRVGILHRGELVAVDTVEGLRRTVGAGAELQLRVVGNPSVDLGSIPGIDRVRQSDGILRVACADAGAKAEVVSRLHSRGVEILDIESEGASPEDVFTAYTTGDRERDETIDDASEQAEVVA